MNGKPSKKDMLKIENFRKEKIGGFTIKHSNYSDCQIMEILPHILNLEGLLTR